MISSKHHTATSPIWHLKGLLATSKWHAHLVYFGCYHGKMWTDQWLQLAVWEWCHLREKLMLANPCAWTCGIMRGWNHQWHCIHTHPHTPTHIPSLWCSVCKQHWEPSRLDRTRNWRLNSGKRSVLLSAPHSSTLITQTHTHTYQAHITSLYHILYMHTYHTKT